MAGPESEMDSQKTIGNTGEDQTDAQFSVQQASNDDLSSQVDVQPTQHQQSINIPEAQSQLQFNTTSPTLDIKPPETTTLQPISDNVLSVIDSTQIPIQEQLQPSPQQPQVQSYPPPIRPLLQDEPTVGPSVLDNGQMQGANLESASLSPQKTAITKVTLSDELNVFYWTKTKEILSQIAEKAKNSVDTVITTLDPGMKEYLYSGGNVNIIVISDTECIVSPIRDAFQTAFGRATVNPALCNPQGTMIDYPIRLACGFNEAVTVAQEKIKKLRQDTSSVPQNQVVAVVQPTLIHLANMIDTTDNSNDSADDNWFSAYCMLIEDPVLGVTMKCFSQMIPVDQDTVESARKMNYPENFPHKSLGFTASIDELMSYRTKVDPISGFGDEYGCYWLREWAGIYETQLIHQLSLTLANSYRRKWNDCAGIETIS